MISKFLKCDFPRFTQHIFLIFSVSQQHIYYNKHLSNGVISFVYTLYRKQRDFPSMMFECCVLLIKIFSKICTTSCKYFLFLPDLTTIEVGQILVESPK